MKKFLFHLLIWTWGFPVSLIGFILFMVYQCSGFPSDQFHYASSVQIHSKKSGGMSIGPYLYIYHPKDQSFSETRLLRTLVHEYGHTFQVLLLGPLYWLVVAIPSFLWANLPCFERYRRKHNISYYSLYCEKWADHLGQKVTGIKI